MAAMRLVLERIVPAYKGETQPIVIDALRNADGLTAQSQAVVGATFIAALGQMAKLIETEKLEERIAALEENRAQ